MQKKRYLIFLIAAAMDSDKRNKAFGIKLPLLGHPAMDFGLLAAFTPDDFEVRFVDATNESIPFEQSCDLALITGVTTQMPHAYKVAERLRNMGTKVLLAGMHVDAFPNEALAYADTVICGEVEAIWEEVLEDFLAGELKRKYAGHELDMTNLPNIRRDLFNKKLYHPVEIIETTRGCPVGCRFCGIQSFFGKNFRTRPPEDIRKELMSIFGPRPAQSRWKKWLAKHWHPDIPYFVEKRILYVADANFSGNQQHAEAILNVFKECDIRWFGHSSFEVTRNERMLDLMAESGCLGLNIGFESLSQDNIDAMGKFQNKTTEYSQAIQRLHQREIGVMGTFIVGFDQDTAEVFDQISQFALDNRLQTAFALILTPLPGTPLFEQMEKENRLLHKDWNDYNHGMVTFRPRNMSPRQLHLGMRRVWKRVYSWKGIWQRILKKPRIRPFFYLMINLNFHRCTRLLCAERLWPTPDQEEKAHNPVQL